MRRSHNVPFTVAHAAAVVPLLRCRSRRWLDATCLVTGSMAPDFEYFLRARMESHVTHTLIGLFVVDVPLALVLAFVFHAIVREPFGAALPAIVRARFARFLATPWRPRIVVAVASAWIGALTHVAWDACTHRTGWLVRALPFLESDVPLLEGVPVYRAMQHASTAIGFLVLFVVIARLPRVVPRAPTVRVASVMFVVLPLLGGLAAALWRTSMEPGHGHAIAASISGALLGICAAAVVVRRFVSIGQPAPLHRS